MNPWSKTKEALLAEFKTSQELGLSKNEAKKRLETYGLNELEEKEKTSDFSLFLTQFKSPLVIILLVAMLIALVKKDFADGVVLAFIILINGVIGWLQERKAEKTMESLKKMVVHEAKVIRDGDMLKISAKHLVPGDIVVLEAGDRIPADGRVLATKDLKINQAILTGESVPVDKSIKEIPEDSPLMMRTNMVYMSTLVTTGKATVLITATDAKTELGAIAKEIVQAETKVPYLQKKIDVFGRNILIASLILAFVVFITGILRSVPVWTIFSVSLSLLVSIVPEGLPLAITVTLSIGLIRMAKKQAVIRQLEAAETLGSATVICADKTGTITEGLMDVEKLYALDNEVIVEGEALSLDGDFSKEGKRHNIPNDPQMSLLLELGSLSTRAKLSRKDLSTGDARQLTDPTETAVMVASARAGYYSFEIGQKHKEVLEIPFNQEFKYSATVHEYKDIFRLIIKGAPELMIKKCTHIINKSGKEVVLSDIIIKELENRFIEYGKQGFRMITVAYKDEKDLKPVELEHVKDLIFVGVYLIDDPIRESAKQAITEAEQAGVKVIMATGDHLSTAVTIAENAGLLRYGKAIHSTDLPTVDINDVRVIARATPTDKFALVESLQKRGEIVAMTGDGVNDAPALKKADIGVAMGKGGTEVAVESADMVLMNNDLGSIVAAIKEGRLIWENIRKIVFCLVSTSIAEVLIVIVALMIGLPLPLLAVQILWMNLVTDGITSIALVAEPAEGDLMKQKPSAFNKSIIDKSTFTRLSFITIIMTIGTLFVFKYYLKDGLAYAQSAALITMVLYQWLNIFNCRSNKRSFFMQNPFSNKYIIILITAALVAQLMVMYIPTFQPYLHLEPLDGRTWLVAFAVSLSIVIVEEIRKLVNKITNG